MQLADTAARKAALDLSTNPLVVAPAGSGKTGLLIQRFLKALAVVEKPEDVLAITFTNKAANEILARFVEALQLRPCDCTDEFERDIANLAEAVRRQDAAKGWQLALNPSRLNIMTIDKLNAYIACQMPPRTGFVKLPQVMDNPFDLYNKVCQALLEDLDDDIVPEADKDAIACVIKQAKNRTDEFASSLVRLIATREQWMSDILVDDVNASVTDALATLVAADLAQVEALAKDELHAAFDIAVLDSDPAKLPWLDSADFSFELHNVATLQNLASLLLTQKGELRKRVTARDGFKAQSPGNIEMNQLLDEIHADKADEVMEAGKLLSRLPSAVDSAEMQRLNVSLARVLTRAIGHLQVLIGDTNSCDFSEIALRALQALGNGAEVNECLEKMDYTISHILVDEMQDTSAIQCELFSRLTSGWELGDGRSLFMVGDPQQSIYGFRQADVRLFQKMWDDQSFNDLPLACLRLESNFRSSGDVVELNNRIFATAMPQHNDVMRGAVAAVNSVPVKPVSGEDAVSVHLCGCDDTVGLTVSETVNAIKADNPNDSVAVLARNRRSLESTIAALKADDVSFACQDIDALAADSVANDVLALILAIWQPFNRNGWVRLLRSPMVGMSYADLAQLLHVSPKATVPSLLASFVASEAPTQEALLRLNNALDMARNNGALAADIHAMSRAIFSSLGGALIYSQDELVVADKVFGLLKDHAPTGSLENVDGFCDAFSRLYSSSESGAVQVMTIHKSKGLEFDHVILVGMEKAWRPASRTLLECRPLPEGTVMVARPEKDGEAEHASIYNYAISVETEISFYEEARLLYVALTRAKKHCHLFAVGVADEHGQAVVVNNSYMGLTRPLWGNAQQHIGQSTVDADSAVLPITWRPKEFPSTSNAIEFNWKKSSTTTAPSMVNREAGAVDQSSVATAIGTVYHEFLDSIGRGGVDRWQALEGGIKTNLVLSRLGEEGLANGVRAAAATVVQNLLVNTLAGQKGQWLLAKHEVDYFELPIQVQVNGKNMVGKIDRLFFDDGVWWLVDYKSDNLNNFANGLESMASHYAPQLQSYAAALQKSEIIGNAPLKLALYSPHSDSLMEVQ